jgi:hypothetical protein
VDKDPYSLEIIFPIELAVTFASVFGVASTSCYSAAAKSASFSGQTLIINSGAVFTGKKSTNSKCSLLISSVTAPTSTKTTVNSFTIRVKRDSNFNIYYIIFKLKTLINTIYLIEY